MSSRNLMQEKPSNFFSRYLHCLSERWPWEGWDTFAPCLCSSMPGRPVRRSQQLGSTRTRAGSADGQSPEDGTARKRGWFDVKIKTEQEIRLKVWLLSKLGCRSGSQLWGTFFGYFTTYTLESGSSRPKDIFLWDLVLSQDIYTVPGTSSGYWLRTPFWNYDLGPSLKIENLRIEISMSLFHVIKIWFM